MFHCNNEFQHTSLNTLEGHLLMAACVRQGEVIVLGQFMFCFAVRNGRWKVGSVWSWDEWLDGEMVLPAHSSVDHYVLI